MAVVKIILQRMKLMYYDNDPLLISDIIKSGNFNDFLHNMTKMVISIENKFLPEVRKWQS